MEHVDLEKFVVRVLFLTLKCDVDINSSRENTPQWDSLKHIQIIFAIEDELNILLPPEVIPNLNSALEIVRHIQLLNNAS